MTIAPPQPTVADALSEAPESTTSEHSGSFASQWLAHPMASAYLVAVPSLLLLGLGTLMVWSASSVLGSVQFFNAYYFITRHVVFLVAGLVAAAVAMHVPLKLLQRLGWVLFGFSGLLMCLTFVPGLGFGINGNNNWLIITNELRVQPSEIAKLGLILWAASVFTMKRKLLGDPLHLLVPFVPGAALLTGLVILQHDLGTAIIMGMITVAILWCVGAPMIILGTLGGAATVGAFALAIANPGRLARLLGFLDPTKDPTGTNFQPNQAQYGLATGGWWGVGLGASRQKWGSLSEAHTDYVLAIIGEELGVMATLLVLALMLLLGYAGFRIAVRSATFYNRMVAAGITCWLMCQAVVNVFVVLRMLPVLGVPLPLVSYGGSSLAVTLTAIGVLLACARAEPQAAEYLAKRKASQKPRARLLAVLPVMSKKQG